MVLKREHGLEKKAGSQMTLTEYYEEFLSLFLFFLFTHIFLDKNFDCALTLWNLEETMNCDGSEFSFFSFTHFGLQT